LTYYFIADRQMEFWPAMEASRTLIWENFGGFFLFVLALIGINILGLIACGVGLFITIPLSLCSTAVAYREMTGGAEGPAVGEQPPQTTA
jgi:uncharacterized membrane protein